MDGYGVCRVNFALKDIRDAKKKRVNEILENGNKQKM